MIFLGLFPDVRMSILVQFLEIGHLISKIFLSFQSSSSYFFSISRCCQAEVGTWERYSVSVGSQPLPEAKQPLFRIIPKKSTRMRAGNPFYEHLTRATISNWRRETDYIRIKDGESACERLVRQQYHRPSSGTHNIGNWVIIWSNKSLC